METTEQSLPKLSRWAKIVKRIENDPVHLEGYSQQLKQDMQEFRDNFAFIHDNIVEQVKHHL
ncbi:MAG: hypothetical protein GY801_14380 [bacterium]|nr:hypothetical protein [bacterium]